MLLLLIVCVEFNLLLVTLFSFIVLILRATIPGVTTNCPNVSDLGQSNSAYVIGCEPAGSLVNTQLKYTLNSSVITKTVVLLNVSPTLPRTLCLLLYNDRNYCRLVVYIYILCQFMFTFRLYFLTSFDVTSNTSLYIYYSCAHNNH